MPASSFSSELSVPCLFACEEVGGWTVVKSNLACRRWFEFDDNEQSMNGLCVDSIVSHCDAMNQVRISCRSGLEKRGLCCHSVMEVDGAIQLVLQFMIFSTPNQELGACEEFRAERFLMEHSKDCLVFVGDDGVIETCNTRAAKLFGKKIIGQSMFVLMDIPTLDDPKSRGVTNETPPTRLEKAFKKPRIPGTLYCLNCELMPSETQKERKSMHLWIRKTYNGSSMRVCEVINDEFDTENEYQQLHPQPPSPERIEEDLFEMMEMSKINYLQSELAFNACVDAILLFDSDSALCVRSNPAATAIFEYSEQELKSITGRMLADPADVNYANTNVQLKQHGCFHSRMLMRKKSGQSFWAICHIELIVSPQDKKMYLTTVKDISDIVRRENELEAKCTKLQSAMSDLVYEDRMNLIGLLSAGVAHEINNPATILQGNLSCLQTSALTNQEPLVNDCIEAVTRICSMIKILSSFSQVDRGIEDLNLNDVILSVHTLMSPEFRGETSLELKLCPELPVFCGDRGKLSQMLVNLIMNSMRAIKDSNKTNEKHCVTIETLKLENPNRVEMKVRDTGCGVDEKLRPHLFKPFITSKEVGEGYGMGLTVCRGIVEQHQGKIELESSDSNGSVFRIEFPVPNSLVPKSGSIVNHFDEDESSIYKTATTSSMLLTLGEKVMSNLDGVLDHRSPRSREREKPKLLCIDDEEMIVKIYARILSRDFQVITANGGQDAVDLLIKHNIECDIVVCDLQMPGISGKGVYEAVEAHRPSLLSRFLFVSAGAVTPELKDFSEKIKKNRKFLGKPVSRDYLLCACNSLLNQ